MKQLTKISITGFLIAFMFIGCNNQEGDENNDNFTVATDSIVIVDFEGLKPYLETKSEDVHIVNFWAMWCAPCVAELPIIEAYQKQHPEAEIVLISLDFPEEIETVLKPFLKEKGIAAKVILLDDPDANSWIDKIDPNWSGAIPFTILFNNKFSSFHERAFTDLQDLKNEINNTFTKP